MAALFESGRVIDLILGLMLLEALLLLGLRRRLGRGPAPREVLALLVAGAALLLAVRAALTGAGWGWVAAWLLAGLIGHAADLLLRWRRGA